VAWLKQQPWFNGVFATNGASYLGYVQWAIAHEAGPELKAMAIQVSTAEFRSQTYTGGSFALDTALSWTNMMANQEKPLGVIRQMMAINRTLRPLFSHLPLRERAARTTLTTLSAGSRLKMPHALSGKDRHGPAGMAG